MPKAKFVFNTESLRYEKMRFSVKERFGKIAYKAFIVSAGAGALLVIASFIMESPKTKKLKNHQSELLLKYEVLNNTLREYEQELANIQFNDDNVYRVYFEAERVPQHRRMSGFGGTDKYSGIQKLKNSDVIISTAKNVELISRKILVQSRSFDEIVEMVMNKEKVLAARPAIQPIALNQLTRFGSSFGMRMHPILNVNKMHEGIDLTAPRGTNVFASAGGTVSEARYTPFGYGKKVVINHGFGYETLYAHLSDIKVKPGQKVKRGEIIGLVGSTGLSTCPHLHYEVHLHNRPVNPINYYANDLSPREYDNMIEMLSQSDPSFDIN
jgi:murein DD-endopeptidase MepM/ murein hydrolase activator NlpD